MNNSLSIYKNTIFGLDSPGLRYHSKSFGVGEQGSTGSNPSMFVFLSIIFLFVCMYEGFV